MLLKETTLRPKHYWGISQGGGGGGYGSHSPEKAHKIIKKKGNKLNGDQMDQSYRFC